MAISISIQEVGSNVVVTGTGSANLSGLSFSSTGVGGLRPALEGAKATVVVSSFSLNFTNFLYYDGGITGPSSFGSGTEVTPNSTSGDRFGVSGTGYSAFGPNAQLFFPEGYSSGDDLSGTSTYNSATIDSLGLTAGTYTWTWPSDSVTVTIASSSTTINTSVTSSNALLTSAISAGTTVEFVIDNPLSTTSYFTLETVPNNAGLYDSNAPTNTSGSFTLDTGQFGLIQSNYIASVVVPPGSTTLTFEPADDIPANTLRLRGVGAVPPIEISI